MLHIQRSQRGRGWDIFSRQEIEFAVEDFETAKKFLEALGYVQIVIYEKFRTIYELKDSHIMLDELPYGEFVEIEGEKCIEIQKSLQILLKFKWDCHGKSRLSRPI